MRILALYDVHGNPDALEAVLANPRATGPDAIVVGGDVVPGAFAGAALDRLQALSGDVHWVRGNGERETAAAVNGPRPAEGDNAAEMSAFAAQQLGPERARALGELPLSVIVDGVLFCHATPRSDEELVTRISPPERWSEVLTDADAALVVAGHTHQQDDRMVSGVRFVNAGSVGLPYEGDGDARWLWIEDGVPELRHRLRRGRRRPAHARCVRGPDRLGRRLADRAHRGNRGDADVRGARRVGLASARSPLGSKPAGVRLSWCSPDTEQSARLLSPEPQR